MTTNRSPAGMSGRIVFPRAFTRTSYSVALSSREQRYSSLNLIGCGGEQLIVVCVTFGSGHLQALFSCLG